MWQSIVVLSCEFVKYKKVTFKNVANLQENNFVAVSF